MIKHVKLLSVIVALIATVSSCKKATDISILEGHKWVLSSANETYSDSGSRSHNLMVIDTVCQTSSYTEFHTNATESALKLAYTYTTTNCSYPHVVSPALSEFAWNIDPDNTVLYLYGNTSDGTGGTWYNIQSISSSSLVLTIVTQRVIGNTGPPNNASIYDTATDTWTYSVK